MRVYVISYEEPYQNFYARLLSENAGVAKVKTKDDIIVSVLSKQIASIEKKELFNTEDFTKFKLAKAKVLLSNIKDNITDPEMQADISEFIQNNL